MTRTPFFALIAAFFLAFIAAGCSGPSQQAEGPAAGTSGVTDVGIGLSPGGGSDVSTESADDEDDVERDTDTDEDEDGDDRGKTTEGSDPAALACGLNYYAYGTIGDPFSLKLVATGGSGSYRFALAAGQALPAGLSLNQGTATVEGTPSQEGSSSVTFTVTDLKDNATRNCKPIKFQIAKKDAKVQSIDPFTPPNLKQDRTIDLSKVPPARLTQFAFGIMGGELMREEEYEGFKLSLLLCANPEMDRECVQFTSDDLKGIKRGRWTSALFDLPEELPGFTADEAGTLKPALVRIGPKHRYASMTQTGKTGPYHVKAVHFALLNERGQVFTYLNPCLEKRLYKGDRLLFGPDDTAICAVISTGDAKKAATYAPIDLLVKLSKEYTKESIKPQLDASIRRSHQLGKDFLHYLDSPHFGEIYEYTKNNNTVTFLTLLLNWQQLDDEDTGAEYEFWNGRTVSFGDYLDFNPFNTNTTDGNVRLRIRPEEIMTVICIPIMAKACTVMDSWKNMAFMSIMKEESQEWLLGGYKVYLFQPGKVNNRDAMRLLLAAVDEEQWVLNTGTDAPDGKTKMAVQIEEKRIYTPLIPYADVKGMAKINEILLLELTRMRW